MLVIGILLPAALIWGVGRVTAQRAVTELWGSLSHEIADHTVERTLRRLETGDTALGFNAAVLGLRLVDPQDRRALLGYLLAGLRANPNVTWYSFGGADGAYLSAYRAKDGIRLTWREQVEGGARYRDFLVDDTDAWIPQPEVVKPYDPRTRAWFEEAAAGPGPVWSKPFLFASGPPGFILSKRVLDTRGALVGVWGIEYEMAYISKFLSGLEIGTSGRAYLLTEAGAVIGHPEAGRDIGAAQGWIAFLKDGKKHIATAGAHRDAQLRAVHEETLRHGAERTGGRFERGGTPYLWSAQRFPEDTGLDWRVVIVVPEADILGRIHASNLWAALLAILITVCVLALVLWYARQRVSKPLQGIAQDLERMSKLETQDAPRVQASPLTEVATLIVAREAMRGGLSSFRKYVPADLVRELMSRGDEARLGGTEQELTVMFSDVADFTRISESLEGPEALVSALGEYLDVMSGAIRLRRGTVDKYIGDAIMAFWGAPIAMENHALPACEAAWDSQQALRVLRYRWEQEGLPPFRARIGVNTGVMLVGNIGATERMNYTVMGDAVNLGSRLEGLCKIYGIEIAIGEATHNQIGERFVTRPVDCVEVKGKSEAVVFHELLGPRVDIDPQLLAFGRTYAAAFAHYRARAFDEARAGFEASLTLRAGDVAAKTLMERCTAYLREPPPDDWSGAIRLTRKR